MTAALCVPDPALCREVDPDMWHAPNGPQQAAAKRICRGCDAREACLEAGMAVPDEDMWGVWGGVSAAGRRALRAADPDRWPVRVDAIAALLGTRVDRYGAERFTPNAYRDDYTEEEPADMVRPPVDWSADAYLANAEALMDRYATETEPGYALTDTSGIVYPVNDIEFAA